MKTPQFKKIKEPILEEYKYKKAEETWKHGVKKLTKKP